MATNPPVTTSAGSGEHTPESFEAIAKEMLETALALHSANRPIVCDEIEDAVSEICADGRSRGVQAERLILELKRAWYSVPEPAAHNKADVISRLVSLCIMEFYRGGSDG